MLAKSSAYFRLPVGSLAQQICRDLKELLNVAPDTITAAKHEKVLDEHFDIMRRSDPQHWIPNE